MRIAGYEILGELGRGGSAHVFKAQSPDGRQVALKLLSRGSEDDEARFAREQRLQAALGEPEGFVPLLAAGSCERGPYLVMPLLERGTLRRRLERGPLGIEETLQLGRALATSIGLAHERGIVHRDLKPENILFADDGRPLIADLGIAKHFAVSMSGSDSITARGAFLGTPSYMAPEQMDCAKTVDSRADVYALGVLLYECLTGRPPFEGSTVQELIARVAISECRPISDLRRDAPFFVTHPIEVALCREPARRYPDGFALADALGARLPQRSLLATTVHEGERRSVRRRPPLWLFAVLGVATPLALWARRRPPPTRDAVGAIAPTPSSAEKRRNAAVAKGWSDEAVPNGLRTGPERPLYVFDTRKGLEIDMVYVPPGDFFMGAINGGQEEKPLHVHPMPRGYYVARTEVTWGEYLIFCRAASHPMPERPSWAETDEHPVVNVSWHDAVAFCDWAGFVLPTEAEWEKAARGSADTRQWPWGDTWISDAANVFDDISGREGDPVAFKTRAGARWVETAPVGSLPRGVSPYGALDMAGNVWEWTADWFDPTVYQAYSDGRLETPPSGTERVVRGGSWFHTRFNATVTSRRGQPPGGTSPYGGFRPILRAGG